LRSLNLQLARRGQLMSCWDIFASFLCSVLPFEKLFCFPFGRDPVLSPFSAFDPCLTGPEDLHPPPLRCAQFFPPSSERRSDCASSKLTLVIHPPPITLVQLGPCPTLLPASRRCGSCTAVSLLICSPSMPCVHRFLG